MKRNHFAEKRMIFADASQPGQAPGAEMLPGGGAPPPLAETQPKSQDQQLQTPAPEKAPPLPEGQKAPEEKKQVSAADVNKAKEDALAASGKRFGSANGITNIYAGIKAPEIKLPA